MAIEKVAILGAGVSGLAAAWKLLRERPGLRVVLFEAGGSPGGLARSLQFDNLKTDLGPHRIHTELADAMEFIRKISGPELIEVRRSSRMLLEGRWIEYPPKPAEMLRLLGPFKMAGFALSHALERGRSLFAGKAAGANGEDTFAQLMIQAFGPALFDFMVRPYVEKVWKTPAGQIHGDVARVRVSAGGLEKLIRQAIGRPKPGESAAALKKYHYLRGGIGGLADRMTQEIQRMGAEISCGRLVVGLDAPGNPGRGAEKSSWRIAHIPTPEAWPSANAKAGERAYSSASALPVSASSAFASELASGGSPSPKGESGDPFDAVISTLPVTELIGLLSSSEQNELARESASHLKFLGNHLFFLKIRRPPEAAGDAQWLYFPQTNVIFNRGYLPANFDASMGAPEAALICLEVTRNPADGQLDAKALECLKAEVVQGARKAGLLSESEKPEVFHHFIPWAYPIYDLEYRARTAAVWEYLGQIPGLFSAGRQGLFLHNNIDHSIHIGLAAAQRLLSDPSAPPKDWYARIETFRSFRIVD